MKLSKAEYDEMIRKRPSLKPTEVIKAPNSGLFTLTPGEPMEFGLIPIPELFSPEKPVKSLPRPNLKASNDESKLNKTEAAWLAELRIRNPKFLGIQAMTFKLGDDCRYTPDFIEISQEDKFIAWEVKGFMRDDALVKLKVAARMFPFLDFYVVKRIKGSWETKKINP